MAISRSYAKRLKLKIDTIAGRELEVEYADGSTGWTSGIVRNASWRIDTKEVQCDFHVLDDLCVDLVLSNDYLFNCGIFSECQNYFFDSNLVYDYEIDKLCNIRLIGRHGEEFGNLEDEYLQDLASTKGQLESTASIFTFLAWATEQLFPKYTSTEKAPVAVEGTNTWLMIILNKWDG
ncbi:hypothetical protein BDV12DRAFT_198654 [Aspergillus spectabilis]